MTCNYFNSLKQRAIVLLNVIISPQTLSSFLTLCVLSLYPILLSMSSPSSVEEEVSGCGHNLGL